MPAHDSTCSIEGCSRRRAKRGWCEAHYMQWWTHGDPLYRHYKPNDGRCSVEGCGRLPRSATSPYCEMHYYRIRRKGSVGSAASSRPTFTQCAQCGKPTHNGAVCCSERCRARYYRGITEQPWPCKECGQPIPPTARRSREFCSDDCAALNLHRRRIEQQGVRDCVLCQSPFLIPYTYPHKQYCSRRCANSRRKLQPNSVCAFCGVAFAARLADERKYCSATCYHAYLKSLSPGREEVKRRGRDRRKALLRGVSFVPIVRTEIYERDGWTCGICGRGVDRRRVYPDPMSVSLDHIIPLSQGGTHEPSNVQCSHLLCNVRKSDRGAGQLRLLG